MNRRPCAVFSLSCLVVCLCSARVASAQSPPTIPEPARKAATAAVVEQHQPAIEAFVREQVVRLQAPSVKVQSEGRKSLVAQTELNSPSTVFLFVYGKMVGQELTGLAQHENVFVRMNAAITAAEFAKRLPNTQMGDVAEVFMRDAAMPVALWGTRGASIILPRLADTGSLTGSKLIPAVSACFEKHPTGPMADEAYHALTLDHPLPTGDRLNVNQMGTVVPAIAPDLIKVFRARVEQYKKEIPSDVPAESVPIIFLSRSQAWSALRPEQQSEVVLLMSELAKASSQGIEDRPKDREATIRLLQRIGGAMNVIGSQVRSSALEKAGKDLSVAPDNVSPSDLATLVDAVTTALSSVSQFKDVAAAGME